MVKGGYFLNGVKAMKNIFKLFLSAILCAVMCMFVCACSCNAKPDADGKDGSSYPIDATER